MQACFAASVHSELRGPSPTPNHCHGKPGQRCEFRNTLANESDILPFYAHGLCPIGSTFRISLWQVASSALGCYVAEGREKDSPPQPPKKDSLVVWEWCGEGGRQQVKGYLILYPVLSPSCASSQLLLPYEHCSLLLSTAFAQAAQRETDLMLGHYRGFQLQCNGPGSRYFHTAAGKRYGQQPRPRSPAGSGC